MGGDDRALDLVMEALDKTSIPIKIFHPTHVTREETTSKVHKGQQGANPKMRMLVYRERSYPAREVQGRDLSLIHIY